MNVKTGLAALAIACALSGCDSTRGAQDFTCERFEDFAIEPAPNPIIADIQRYGVENRGGDGDGRSQSSSQVMEDEAGDPSVKRPVGQTIGEAAFGLSDAELIDEAARLRDAYEAAKTERDAQGGNFQIMGEGPLENEIIVESRLEPRNVLLLSGGGQWGAYGAGLFLGMACTQALDGSSDGNTMPCIIEGPGGARQLNRDAIQFDRLDAMKIGVITGVSTGGLQSLLLMVILDPTQHEDTRKDALAQLLDSYAPEAQSDLVDYDGYLAIVFQGSVAGTDELREHVDKVLQNRWGFRDAILNESRVITGYEESNRRLVDHIAKSPIRTVVGVVEGEDGDFKSVDMKRMVSLIQPDNPETGEEVETPQATDCVLATTLASSAMPVFHQQLRVVTAANDNADEPSKTTLFDGGVRRSVFVSELGEGMRARYAMLAQVMGRELYTAASQADKLPKVYVLRNGPTTATEDAEVNNTDGAINQALRAYSLLVNELEVGSIAALRLANPYGIIEISTADGSQSPEVAHPGRTGALREKCTKNDEMFDPEFMRCLQRFGARRGMMLEFDEDGRTIPDFWPLSSIEAPPELEIPEPANDN